MKKMNPSVQNLTLAALFLAAGLVLPFLTGQIPQIGSMLLPMHLPVLLCGLVCGWQYGALIGFVLPLLRFALFGMPPIFPTGIAMCFELAAYGFLAGWLWAHSRWKCVKALYACLFPAMIGGRVVWGVAEVILLGLSGSAFTWGAFIAGALLNAVPGIILQLLFIPAFMVALDRTGFRRFGKNEGRTGEAAAK